MKMKRTKLLKKINNCLAYDYEIHEVEAVVYGELKKMLFFYLKEEYENLSIINHYHEAIDLIYSTADIYEVTIVEWAKLRAFSYYKDEEDGRVLIGLEDFDLFVKGQCECAPTKVGTDLIEMHFAMRSLSNKHLAKISEMKRFNDVIKYIVDLSFIEPIQTRGWLEEYDFEDFPNELNESGADNIKLNIADEDNKISADLPF